MLIPKSCYPIINISVHSVDAALKIEFQNIWMFIPLISQFLYLFAHKKAAHIIIVKNPMPLTIIVSNSKFTPYMIFVTKIKWFYFFL